jgi:hypothetical protein
MALGVLLCLLGSAHVALCARKSDKPRSTPLPEQMASPLIVLPQKPVLPAVGSLGTPSSSAEADVEPGMAVPSSRRSAKVSHPGDEENSEEIFGKAMAIYAARAAAGSSGPLVELPVTNLSGNGPILSVPVAPTPAPVIATSSATVAPQDSTRLRESRQGFLVGKEGIHAVEKTNITPPPGSIEMVDLTGGKEDLPTSSR